MTEVNEVKTVLLDPSINVKSMVEDSIQRLDDLRKIEVKRIDEKIDANNEKYQIQFNDSKEAIQAALTATNQAISKAEQANEKRFDAVNEFRSTLGDQQAKLLTRTEYDSAHSALAEKINAVTDRINRTEGASGVYVTQTDLTNALSKLEANIQATLIPVVNFMNSSTGKQQGISASWGFALGAMGIIIAVLTVALRIAGK